MTQISVIEAKLWPIAYLRPNQDQIKLEFIKQFMRN